MTSRRRDLLGAAGCAMLAASSPPVDDGLAVLGRRLTGLLSNPRSARHIAEAYMGGTGESDFRRAAIDLDMPAVLFAAAGIVTERALRTWLGTRIRADFATGAVLDVDGWRLSRTEVGVSLMVASVAGQSTRFGAV